MKYYRRFPGDYLRDTMDLSLEEHGAYTLLLDHCYATETPIQSEKAAQKICHSQSKSERFAVHLVLGNFFQKMPNGEYQNSRVEKELSYADSISKVKKRAAEIRHKKHAHAKHMHSTSTYTPDSILQSKEGITQTGSFVDESSIMQVQMKGKNKSAAAPFSFPPNVPIYLWNEFATMRNKIRKPMTNHAAELIGKKLLDLETQGENVIDVVQQSIRNCWQDVFPVRKDQQNAAGKPSKEQLRFERSQEAIAGVKGSYSRLADALRANIPRRNHAGTGTGLLRNAEGHSTETPAPSVPARDEKK